MWYKKRGTGIRLIVSGGGTGGHLFPGIAVAEAVLARSAESEVLFVGTGRHTDVRVLESRSFAHAVIKCQGLKGKTVLQKISSVLQLPLALVNAARLIKKFKPDLVLGVGGYVTGPVLMAAKILGVHTCIHEQNSVPGMANRKLGRFVSKVFLSIPGSEKYFDQEKSVMTGNPVRKELIEIAEEKKPGKGQTLLTIGGSLGAHRVNTLMIGAMKKMKDQWPKHFKVIHQTGTADEKMVKDHYEEIGLSATVAPFFDDMAALYKQADVVISRAGATSIAEMAVLKLPMILIPFPYAADNHQQKNGDYLVKGGAAKMFIEKDLTEELLVEEITNLLGSEEKRKKMSAAAGKLARPNATEAIVSECEKLAGNPGSNN